MAKIAQTSGSDRWSWDAARMEKRMSGGVVAAAVVLSGLVLAGPAGAADVGAPVSRTPQTAVGKVAKGVAKDVAKGKVRCAYTPTPDRPPAKPVKPPRPKAPGSGTVTVKISTNHGAIVMEFDRANAPCAVHNFVHLTRSRFYNDTRCWRLTNYDRLGVLQCGDIFAAEEGGPGYEFDDELTGDEKYPRGTVAMGNFGPDTNGSQFFMVYSRAEIPPAYTILGRVVSGMDVLDRIAAGGIVPGPNPDDGEPRLPVEIHRVKVRG